MIYLIIGFIITLISLLVGYNLGRHQAMIAPDVKKQITQIFNKVVSKSEVGPVLRPDVQANFYRDNPTVAREHQIMHDQFDNLNTERR